jgi:hypothetical protein
MLEPSRPFINPTFVLAIVELYAWFTLRSFHEVKVLLLSVAKGARSMFLLIVLFLMFALLFGIVGVDIWGGRYGRLRAVCAFDAERMRAVLDRAHDSAVPRYDELSLVGSIVSIGPAWEPSLGNRTLIPMCVPYSTAQTAAHAAQHSTAIHINVRSTDVYRRFPA